MRSEREKKSITKSIKLSPSQVQQIEEKAKEKNLTFSSYMVDCAVHGNNSITPQMAVRMQELVNMVLEIADSIDSTEYIRKEELRQKAHDLDGLFTSVSPQEKYENLQQKNGLVCRGRIRCMGIFKVIRNTNDELDYLYNVLNYTMGIHTDYDKRYSPNVDIYNAYEQFLSVKKYFGKTSGNPAFHFIVVYDARSTWGENYERAESMSRSIASYFSDKYQIVYAIHRKLCSKKYGCCSSVYHAHFVMNSVSYIDGTMFSGNRSELYAFLDYIKQVTGDKSWITQYGSEKGNGCQGVSDVRAV